MMEAKMKCMAPMESRKGKGKGKKPSKCPSVDDIVEEVAKEMSDEICIFQELGWMDADWNEDEAMYMADIASLPSILYYVDPPKLLQCPPSLIIIIFNF